MIVGERLAELRKLNGLKQKDLARILQVSVKTISSYERGLSSPPDDIKIKIAKRFNVSVDYLLGLTSLESYSETKNTITIPKGCSEEFIREVETYIEFLLHKHEKKSGK